MKGYFLMSDGSHLRVRMFPPTDREDTRDPVVAIIFRRYPDGRETETPITRSDARIFMSILQRVV